jgi:FdrA protein
VPVEYSVVSETYHDSVNLLRVASDAREAYDLADAFAVMGTPANREQLVDASLVEPGELSTVGPDDLVLAARAGDADEARGAVEAMRDALQSGGADPAAEPDGVAPKTQASALAELERPRLALVSTPGEYAVREAWKALHEGLDVHLFSDGVSLSDEHELKTFAREHDLLVMGPDCGTAIVDGVPLGFANDVARGSVGVVSASGTGLQEVTTLLDRAGGGVSQAVGAGGRDLTDQVGGLTTRASIKRLDADPDTETVVVVSKPPEPAAASAVLEAVTACETPVVVDFLGGDDDAVREAGATPAATLAEAASLALGDDAAESDGSARALEPTVGPDLSVEGDVRGLFTGGTLCTEAALSLSETVEGLATNVGVGDAVADPLAPSGDALVDLGADDLTAGRPHPMIDPTLRDDLLARTLADDAVGVVLLDVVLGYGAHPDPAVGIVDALADAADPPPVVASVCGTDADPQSRASQVAALEDAGVVVAPSNAAAARLAARATGAEREAPR